MSTGNPLVSIITPVYKSEDILARAVGSLLAQSLREWEAIFVDDGSPESSWRVVQAYGWIDPRIRAVRQIHGGACKARNTGIAEARGQFILFLDADDWLEPDALAAMVGACQANQLDAVHGMLRYVTPQGAPTLWEGGFSESTNLFDALAGSNVLSVPSAAMVRREVFQQIGTFDPTLVHCGDWDLWARLARHDGPIGHVHQTVTHYRMRPGSLSRSPRTLLRDAMTVLNRVHAPDGRVLRPCPQAASGADPAQLPARICHFAAYAAGLAICGGGFDAAEPLLDSVPQWAPLSPQRAGEFVFYAMCFAHCCGPERVADFWPQVIDPLKLLLADLQRRTGAFGLAEEMLKSIETCCQVKIDSLPLPLPLPLDWRPPAPRVTTANDTVALTTLRALASDARQ